MRRFAILLALLFPATAPAQDDDSTSLAAIAKGCQTLLSHNPASIQDPQAAFMAGMCSGIVRGAWVAFSAANKGYTPCISSLEANRMTYAELMALVIVYAGKKDTDLTAPAAGATVTTILNRFSCEPKQVPVPQAPAQPAKPLTDMK